MTVSCCICMDRIARRYGRKKRVNVSSSMASIISFICCAVLPLASKMPLSAISLASSRVKVAMVCVSAALSVASSGVVMHLR